jgi:hypothetical protein
VAEVNAQDDSLRRFVVQHYRYDPERRERRNVVVAAYDNETEFLARINAIADDLATRARSGTLADPRENVSGTVLEPGHHALQRNAHLLKNAMAHGVAPGVLLDLPLPSNVAIGWAVVEDETS